MNLQDNIKRILREETEIPLFIRRRFKPEELEWLINDIKELIEFGESLDTAIYDGTREFIKSRKFSDIDEFGDEQSYWDSYLRYERPLVDYVKQRLNIQESIRRILREETQIPTHIRRRLNFSDTVDEFKKNSLRYMDDRSVTKAITKGSNYTASELIPYDEDDDSYSWDEHGDIIDILSEYLISEYGDEVKEYLEETLPEGSFDDDGYNYVFWKHSERFGGSGFSESYSTWGKLMIYKGWWFPLNWGEIKSELDKSNQTDLMVLKPGDKHNTTGYYFTIRKIKKQ